MRFQKKKNLSPNCHSDNGEATESILDFLGAYMMSFGLSVRREYQGVIVEEIRTCQNPGPFRKLIGFDPQLLTAARDLMTTAVKDP